MKILHICQRDDPRTGGSLRVAEALVYEQQHSGLDSWLLFLYGKPAHIAEAFSPKAVCLGLKSSCQAMRGVILLWQAIRKINPEIIHMHDGILWPRLVLMLIRIPVVMHSHLPAKKSRRRLANWLIKLTSDKIIGISPDTVESWAKEGFPSVHIPYVANGVNFEWFRPAGITEKTEIRKQLSLPANGKLVLWVGQLHLRTKGTDRVERTAELMPDHLTLVVVGYGPEFDGMQERCCSLLKAGRLIMVGSTNNTAPYYQACDLFLFTSYKEPFGLVILEAVASGLPIVSFPITHGGGAVELLREVNSYSISDDAGCEEIESIFSVAMSRSSEAVEMRGRIKNKYSWSVAASAVETVYRDLLGKARVADRPKVLVCQHGARHRYAIPRMLDRVDMLTAFYTDSSSVSHIGRFVKLLGDFAPESLRNYARWNINCVPRSKIYSTDLSVFTEFAQRLLRSHKSGIQLYRQRHRILSSRMKKWGLQGSNVVYSMYHENLDFICWAKDRGASSVVDVFISPITDQIMKEERVFFPDWASAKDPSEIEFEQKLWEEAVSLADLLICPSEWVAEGIRSVSPDVAAKIRVVPYGCSMDYQGHVNKPVKGRILFAGRDPLRKGLHYLAQATSRLRSSIPELDVRVAGDLPENIMEHPVCKDLSFLGQLNDEQMRNEYLSADALVLPALSEGFAGVVAEAIGAGCPVIVTREAGSPIVHEREGLIIPARDVDALVAAIRRMVMDRPFREQCSSECLQQAPFYSENAWQDRLVRIIQETAS